MILTNYNMKEIKIPCIITGSGSISSEKRRILRGFCPPDEEPLPRG